MKLFVVGLRRSGTTIVYDALREGPGLRCYYEPLREEDETVGGGSGARDEDAFAETREARERFRLDRYPELHSELFNWGGPRDPAVELEPELPDHVRDLLAHLLESADDVAIKETRLHHKLGAIAEIKPEAVVVHVVRDPRAVTASMLLGRRRRTDIYTDADTFFTARTGRRLWSSRQISEQLIEQRRSPDLPADIPDFLRPLLLWKSAFETTTNDGERLFGDRFAMVRLEDLRADPHRELARMYALADRPVPDHVSKWISKHIRRQARVRYAEDPRWARAARLLEMEPELERSGYAGLLELDLDPDTPLDLTPPEPRSRLAGFMGRARRRARRSERPGRALD
jgi:Sulfotransferase family